MVANWSNPGADIGAGLIFIPLAGFSQLLCYAMCRWYTNKLYDAPFIDGLMDCSENSDQEPSDSEDTIQESSTDSVLASIEQKKI